MNRSRFTCGTATKAIRNQHVV